MTTKAFPAVRSSMLSWQGFQGDRKQQHKRPEPAHLVYATMGTS